MNTQASMRRRFAASVAPLMQRWHRLESRQQRLFVALAALMLLALLLAYVWLPAVRERDRLIIRLPQLNAQLALMKKQADEVRQLNSMSPLTPAPSVTPDIAALQSAFGESARISVDSNRAFRVVIPKTSYANWWDRVADVRARHQLQIVSLTLQALPGKTREVSLDMLLSDQTRNVPSSAQGARK